MSFVRRNLDVDSYAAQTVRDEEGESSMGIGAAWASMYASPV